jgi:hypothetical protein
VVNVDCLHYAQFAHNLAVPIFDAMFWGVHQELGGTARVSALYEQKLPVAQFASKPTPMGQALALRNFRVIDRNGNPSVAKISDLAHFLRLTQDKVGGLLKSAPP